MTSLKPGADPVVVNDLMKVRHQYPVFLQENTVKGKMQGFILYKCFIQSFRVSVLEFNQ